MHTVLVNVNLAIVGFCWYMCIHSNLKKTDGITSLKCRGGKIH